jgi:3',5'-cyclic AMP phosphodiesterase CpdA
MIVLAHLSDTHFDGTQARADRSAQVMNYLDDLPQPVDAIVITGDIADHGLAEEYEQARKILAGSSPVLICPGNHDNRATYREVLLGRPGNDAPINQVHHIAGAVFALCDSSVPGRDDGFLTDETMLWLERVLTDAPAEAPVFICLHHPPAIMHQPILDEIRLRGEHRLAELIARHLQVVAILCGHLHSAAATSFAGRPLLAAPGIASTLRLPWESGDILDFEAPPALAFHVLDDDHRLTTHYRLLAR